MKVTIAKASHGEGPEIEALAKACYTEHQSKISAPLWKAWIEGVISSLRSRTGTILVLREDERIVGTVQLYLHAADSDMDGWPSDQGAGSLRVFAVHPACRGKGYGVQLIEESIACARAAGLKKLFLHTGSINEAAIHIFEKLGFQRLPAYDVYPYGQQDHLALAYELAL